uniref:Phosphatidylinositol-specific phospholipase C X domain-containing protein n=1 Tax=Kryptolebias marmoratus TaxID=37003 RepID=A0A3Q3AHY1_KRYMA
MFFTNIKPKQKIAVKLISYHSSTYLSNNCWGLFSFYCKSVDTQNIQDIKIRIYTPVSAVSIPGSHESLKLYGGPLAVCQVWTLDQQLRAGLRFFDIHAGFWLPTQTDLSIRDSNWKFWQNSRLDEVFRKILHFLDSHQTEAVLLRVTLHGFYKERAVQLVKKLIKKNENRFWTKHSVPKMKDARGKIVFLQNKMFPVGAENQKLFFFEFNKLKDVEGKVRRIRTRFCGQNIVLTENPARSLRSPKSLARSVNKQLKEFLQNHRRTSSNLGCLGVLSLDFPGPDLIQDIIIWFFDSLLIMNKLL